MGKMFHEILCGNSSLRYYFFISTTGQTQYRIFTTSSEVAKSQSDHLVCVCGVITKIVYNVWQKSTKTK